MSPEFLALDLQEGLQALGELTGETTPDEVLGAIFGSFCIGK
jgi:tRNA modification GTPase